MNQNYKNIAYSILELALVSEGLTPAETLKNSLKLAQAAESYGYKRFWLAEHHNSISIASAAPQILIGYIAAGTKTIRVGYAFPQEIDKIQQYFSTNNSAAKVRANVAEGVNVPIYILGSSTDSAHLAAKKGLPYAFASHFATTHLFDALNIYYNEFQPSEYLKEPYTMAGVNVIIGDTDEAAEQMLTTLIRGIVGILTGKRSRLQAPMTMTQELRDISKHPAVQQMLKYSFVGNKETVKQQTAEFLSKTGVNELIAVTNIYDIADRIKSYQAFAEIMGEMKYAVEETELDTIK